MENDPGNSDKGPCPPLAISPVQLQQPLPPGDGRKKAVEDLRAALKSGGVGLDDSTELSRCGPFL